MIQSSISIHWLRLGEVFALVLGFSLSSLAVFARVYTKTRLIRTMGKEDYFSVLAWLLFLAYIAIAIVIGKHEGSAEHIANLTIVESTIYGPIIVTVRVSILLQYITLFVTHRGTAFHYTVQGLIWTNVLFYTIVTVLSLTQCTPIQKLWNPTMPGHCFNRYSLGVLSGIMNIISDFSILILPLPMIWRLQIPWVKKSRVFAVFGVGLFACIASILRLAYSIELVYVPPNTTVYQLHVDRIGLWGFAEVAIGIILGCLPVLPRFFKQCSSTEAGLSSKFEILSGASRTLWRRFFRKSTTPELSRNETTYYNRKLPSRHKPSKTTRTPYIETLNLTRDSGQLAKEYLPRRPSPAYDEGSSMAASGITTTHAERNEGNGFIRIPDLERAIPAGWVR